MFVYIASDHAGFDLKNSIIDFLKADFPEFQIKDFGANILDENDDYPDFIFPSLKEMQEKILEDKKVFGIILGGSGTGEAILANRFENIKAVVCNSQNLEIIKLARMHNDANVISFGARFIDFEFSKKAIREFLQTDFLAGKYERRIEKQKDLIETLKKYE